MRSVYVVDDDADDISFVKHAFTRIDRTVELKTFPDGQSLLSELRKSSKHPSLILMDQNMPIMSGTEALRQIRKSKEFSRLIVVMFSTSNNPHDKQASFLEGANDYIIKPCSIVDYEKVATYLITRWIEPVQRNFHPA